VTSHATRTVVRAALLAALLAAVLAACVPQNETQVSRPEGGPFDPGQSGLPLPERAEAVCGPVIVGHLRTMSERYFDIAREWERYETYAGGVLADGVTADEYAGAVQRDANIEAYLAAYTEAADALRADGGTLVGDFVADCDREVLVRFEAVYQERQPEIDYVTDESAKITEDLRLRSGSPENQGE